MVYVFERSTADGIHGKVFITRMLGSGIGQAKRPFDLTAKIGPINARRRIGRRKRNQTAAGRDGIQAYRGYRITCGRFVFAKCQQLRTEITEGSPRVSHVSHGLVILANLPGTKRQFSRLR
jgi:hypothetical protein